MIKSRVRRKRPTRAGAYLVPWLRAALSSLGGRGTVTEVCRAIWRDHSRDLRRLGDPYYTWQYDTRWAAYLLREAGEATFRRQGRNTVWELTRAKQRPSRAPATARRGSP